jgi:hypothetical protein
MTDKLYVGTPLDCNAVRAALDFAMGLPTPGTVNGVPIVDEPTRLQMVALWWAMTPEQRNSLIENPVAPWVGWTFQYTNLETETAPGTRHCCWIPGDMNTVIQASNAAGRTLSLAQLTTLNAASLAGIAAYPANWVFPE